MIHRDVKPENIFISREGEVFLLILELPARLMMKGRG